MHPRCRTNLSCDTKIPYTFETNWQYDSWNRLVSMQYPDGETVTYEYNNGGKLYKMTGDKNSVQYDYIRAVLYDQFESRTYMEYGNGTHSEYTYHPQNRRLTNLKSYEMSGLLMHDISYYYDDAGNITGQGNYGDYVNGNSGGTYEYAYDYDDLYRLTGSYGYFSSHNNGYKLFDLSMDYSPSGNITNKTLSAQTLINGNQVNISYNNDYYYNDRPHTVTEAGNFSFEWDGNGNMVWRSLIDGERYQCWDEENRLTVVRDKSELSQASVYLYDAGGERAWKFAGQELQMKLSGKTMYSSINFDKTLYTSPYLVMTEQEYTKHYFIEGERVCSKIGGGFAPAPWLPSSAPLDFLQGCHDELGAQLMEKIHRNLACADYHFDWKIQPALEPAHNESDEPETLQYFYHPDHLGSASFVTDATGYVDQHIQYLPFGELFISQRNNEFDTRYKFTAKELDNETNYTYFGARYYDSDISIWLSVDPLSDKYPNLSPFNYCSNRPIVAVDPDGRDGIIIVDKETKTLTVTAIYYVPTKRLSSVKIPMYHSKDIEYLNTSINSFLNKQKYKVTEGEYTGYDVKFNLQFVDGGTHIEAYSKLGTDLMNGYSISNTFEKSNAKYYPRFKMGKDGKIIGGLTSNFNQIIMNTFCDTKRNRIHEIFHTLFFNEDDAASGIGSYGTEEMPNQNDINILINNVALPKVEKNVINEAE
jgi:RHS repeat-associated protein